MTIEELQRQVVRQLKDNKGFDINLDQRLAYLMSEVGEIAGEVLELSRGTWNLCYLVDLKRAFAKKADLKVSREW